MSTAVVTLVTSGENKEGFGESEDGSKGWQYAYREGLKVSFMLPRSLRF